MCDSKPACRGCAETLRGTRGEGWGWGMCGGGGGYLVGGLVVDAEGAGEVLAQKVAGAALREKVGNFLLIKKSKFYIFLLVLAHKVAGAALRGGEGGVVPHSRAFSPPQNLSPPQTPIPLPQAPTPRSMLPSHTHTTAAHVRACARARVRACVRACV